MSILMFEAKIKASFEEKKKNDLCEIMGFVMFDKLTKTH